MSKKTSKQVLYPSLFKRIITSIMDMLVVSIIFTPLTSWINRGIFMDKYGALLAQNDVDVRDQEAVMQLFSSPEMAKYASFTEAMEVALPMLFIHVLTLGIYFVGSWHFIGTSPMKYMLGMRILDEQTGKRPKLVNLIWRFVGYSMFLIGIWSIIFTKKKQALHDKLAKTVVVRV